jgi:hypothetical protein
MTIHVSVSAGAMDRIVKETYRSDVMPGMDGRLGRSELMHFCFSARLVSSPEVEVSSPGALTVRVPVEGILSIPWGMGMKFHMDASTDVALALEDGKLKADVGKITFQDLRLGNGCSMPRKVLDLIGPFVHGAIFRGWLENGLPPMDLPSIPVPMTELAPEAPPMEMRITYLGVEPPGVIVGVGMDGDDTPPAPLPPQDDWDIVASISEATAEAMVGKAMEQVGDIKGSLSFPVPDPRMLADVFMASAETLTTFGRRGLGRRGLRNPTSIKVEYSARTGRPNLNFLVGNKIVLRSIPAHINAVGHLEVDRFKGGLIARLRSFFRPNKESDPQLYEKVSMGSWDFNEDFIIEQAEVTVKQENGALPCIKLTSLDLELKLPWPFPNEVLEKLAESLGKDIMACRLPSTLPREFPLPPGIPFKLALEDLRISTAEGTIEVRGKVDLVPEGTPDEMRRAVEERMRVVEQKLTGSSGTS